MARDDRPARRRRPGGAKHRGPHPPGWLKLGETYYACSDPAARLSFHPAGAGPGCDGPCLIVESHDPQALLFAWADSPRPGCWVSDLETGYTTFTDNPLMLAALFPAPPHLTEDDLCILRELLEHHPSPVLLVDLEAGTAVSRRTVGRRLGRLRGLGLTCRPGGERGGEALTVWGLRALQALRDFAH